MSVLSLKWEDQAQQSQDQLAILWSCDDLFLGTCAIHPFNQYLLNSSVFQVLPWALGAQIRHADPFTHSCFHSFIRQAFIFVPSTMQKSYERYKGELDTGFVVRQCLEGVPDHSFWKRTSPFILHPLPLLLEVLTTWPYCILFVWCLSPYQNVSSMRAGALCWLLLYSST